MCLMLDAIFLFFDRKINGGAFNKNYMMMMVLFIEHFY
jgi:hypothetical protein